MHRLFTLFPLLSILASSPHTVLEAQNRELLGEYRIGLVGRSLSDAYFQAVQSGAQDAARDLGDRYSIDIELVMGTPLEADRETQFRSLSQLYVEGVDGIAISPVDGENLRPLLETMIDQGIEVAFFESEIQGFDALASLPAFETRAGRLAGLAVGPEMTGNGRVAILVPNNADARIKARLEGARAALGYRRIYGLVECEADYASALAAISQALDEDSQDLIEGWVLLGDWPLNGTPALPWEAGEVPCAAIGASPSALMHLDRDHITTLVVHPYYEWGYRSVEALIQQLHTPRVDGDSAAIGISDSAPVSAGPKVIDWSNREDYGRTWQDWIQ